MKQEMLNFELVEWELQACHERGARKISCARQDSNVQPLKHH